MHQLFVESRTPGVLQVNGFFCGPLEGEGQVFPTGKNAEIFIQFFPYGHAQTLTVCLRLDGGAVSRLEPQETAYALIWPDGVIQLELICAAEAPAPDEQGGAVSSVLLRYLAAKLAGDPQADICLLRAQDSLNLAGYDAVVPLRFAPANASERFDERAGLVARLAPNIARVDAVLASTVPAGQGRKMIERVEILRT